MKKLFHQLSELEQKIFTAKLLQAIRNNNQAYYDAVKIIQEADSKGEYDKVKFFNEQTA